MKFLKLLAVMHGILGILRLRNGDYAEGALFIIGGVLFLLIAHEQGRK